MPKINSSCQCDISLISSLFLPFYLVPSKVRATYLELLTPAKKLVSTMWLWDDHQHWLLRATSFPNIFSERSWSPAECTLKSSQASSLVCGLRLKLCQATIRSGELGSCSFGGRLWHRHFTGLRRPPLFSHGSHSNRRFLPLAATRPSPNTPRSLSAPRPPPCAPPALAAGGRHGRYSKARPPSPFSPSTGTKEARLQQRTGGKGRFGPVPAEGTKRRRR